MKRGVFTVFTSELETPRQKEPRTSKRRARVGLFRGRGLKPRSFSGGLAMHTRRESVRNRYAYK